MKFSLRLFSLLLFLLPALWLVSWAAPPSMRGRTLVELTEGETGRRLAAQILEDGEEVVYTWTNSLFGLRVTEVFIAREGRLDLVRVTFEDPSGRPPPAVTARDLDDLYHTGGPFRAEGLSKPFTRIFFRVGEIGHPELKFGNERVDLARQVGFGGSVLLRTRKIKAAE